MVNNRKRYLLQRGSAITLLAEEYNVPYLGTLVKEGEDWFLKITMASVYVELKVFPQEKELKSENKLCMWKKLDE